MNSGANIEKLRACRFHGPETKDPFRTDFQRDRDRILYCLPFRRLAGVTQVVPLFQGRLYHNRLTHTLKVAQIGRRLAEYLLKEQPDIARAAHIDLDVVEAACLAHDLGHPPFGHVGERHLNDLVNKKSKNGPPEGYNANAQTFRILTKLTVLGEEYTGLNLTCATLNAVLKYPWLCDADDDTKKKKWGAYRSEEEEFKFVQTMQKNEQRSIEAEIMDWADDITYAVHDIEDFYREGIIPLDKLFASPRDSYSEELSRFVDSEFDSSEVVVGSSDEILMFFRFLSDLAPWELREPYRGTEKQRGAIRHFVSQLVKRYIDVQGDTKMASEPAVRLGGTPGNSAISFVRSPWARTELGVLKRVTAHYVFGHPGLAAVEYGQNRALKEIFNILFDVIANRDWRRVLPIGCRDYLAREERKTTDKKKLYIRVAADLIAGMTEEQIFAMHQRLTGASRSSPWDVIVC